VGEAKGTLVAWQVFPEVRDPGCAALKMVGRVGFMFCGEWLAGSVDGRISLGFTCVGEVG